ncbi:MAG: MFS transporter, partial [Methylocella sp.]
MGTWAGFSALTTAVGPVLGGWLADTLSWRAIFVINVPIAMLTLGLAFWHVPESRGATDDGTVDRRGALLAVLGLAGLAY